MPELATTAVAWARATGQQPRSSARSRAPIRWLGSTYSRAVRKFIASRRLKPPSWTDLTRGAGTRARPGQPAGQHDPARHSLRPQAGQRCRVSHVIEHDQPRAVGRGQPGQQAGGPRLAIPAGDDRRPRWPGRGLPGSAGNGLIGAVSSCRRPIGYLARVTGRLSVPGQQRGPPGCGHPDEQVDIAGLPQRPRQGRGQLGLAASGWSGEEVAAGLLAGRQRASRAPGDGRGIDAGLLARAEELRQPRHRPEMTGQLVGRAGLGRCTGTPASVALG